MLVKKTFNTIARPATAGSAEVYMQSLMKFGQLVIGGIACVLAIAMTAGVIGGVGIGVTTLIKANTPDAHQSVNAPLN